jgi:dienelactone hydrolase
MIATMDRLMRRRVIAASIVGVLVLIAACDWRGPNPTEDSLAADQGPFAIAQLTVPAGSGFGGGTIYYPTDTSEGLFGAVAVVPGFTANQSSIAWYGPRVASHGFVVFTIDTNSGFDFPASRGDQLLAALDYLTTSSAVADRVDPNRRAVMGWSMGGGGSLEAALDDPTLRAAIPLAGWHTTTNWSSLVVPTLVVGCQNDAVAPVALHSEPFYDSLSGGLPKAYLEIADGAHGCVTTDNDTIARQVISFLKRFVDGDTRYDPFLCPAPAAAGPISQSESTCPYTPATTTTTAGP